MSAHISIKQHSYFKWYCSKAWKQMSGMILNQLHPKFAAKLIAKWNEHVDTCIDWTSFDFLNKDFFSNLLLKTVFTVQPPISKISTNLVSLTFSFLTLMSCSVLKEPWAKIVQRRKKSTPIYVSGMPNERTCINEGLHSRIVVYIFWPWYSTRSTWQSWNDNPAYKKLVQGCWIWWVIYCFFKWIGLNS